MAVTVCLIVFSLVAVCDVVSAQGRRTRRPSRRVTNPTTARPSTTTPTAPATPDAPATQDAPATPEAENPNERVVSTAEDQAQEDVRPQPRRRQTNRRNSNTSREESLQETVETLSGQVNSLTQELNQLKTQQRAMVDLERLSRVEQRIETSRAQLREVMEKESQLQARRDQIEIEILPQNIETRAGISGTTRPEVVREQIRTNLEAERTRIQNQLSLMMQSRAQLEVTITNADAERARLQERVDRLDETNTTTGTQTPVTNQNTTNQNTGTQTNDANPPRNNVPR